MQSITRTKHHAVIIAILIILFCFLVLLIWPDVRRTDTSSKGAEILASVMYQCAEGKSIHAVYTPGSVQLELSDLRAITLTQAESASGVRYASQDGRFVFWNKADSAFMQENNTLTFTDCAGLPAQ